MTNDRKEPTMSAIRPEQDEIAARQRQQPPTAGRKPAVGTPVSSRPVVVKSKLAPFALLLAITALGLAGFVYWQFMLTQQSLVAAEARIVDLEGQLALTGDESNASMAAMQAKLKWADSEIRKLWGVSYDTNRKKIEASESAIAALEKKTSGIQGKVDKALKASSTELKVLSDVVDAQQASFASVDKQQGNLQTQMQALIDRLNLMEAEQKQTSQRIKANEQAVEAIDAFRVSVNRDLLQLKSGSATTP